MCNLVETVKYFFQKNPINSKNVTSRTIDLVHNRQILLKLLIVYKHTTKIYLLFNEKAEEKVIICFNEI